MFYMTSVLFIVGHLELPNFRFTANPFDRSFARNPYLVNI